MKFFIFCFIFLFFCQNVKGSYYQINLSTQSLELIDVTTFFLPTASRQGLGLWIDFDSNGNPSCTYAIDTQHSIHDYTLEIHYWVRNEYDYGDSGAIAIIISIIDLDEFFNFCINNQVWHDDPHDCEFVKSNMIELISNLISNEITFGAHKTGIGFASNGISYEIYCRTPQDVINMRLCQSNTTYCDTTTSIGYKPCNSDDFLLILQANPNSRNFKIF